MLNVFLVNMQFNLIALFLAVNIHGWPVLHEPLKAELAYLPAWVSVSLILRMIWKSLKKVTVNVIA